MITRSLDVAKAMLSSNLQKVAEQRLLLGIGMVVLVTFVLAPALLMEEQLAIGSITRGVWETFVR